ncbi:MAG: PIG-L family deacetylase [Terriglobia bacterium]
MMLKRLLIAILLFVSSALVSAAGAQSLDLAIDRGAVGLVQALDRLPSTARVMFVAAHPDDENSGLLPYVSRGLHAKTALLTLTRGEGGQNLIGSEMYEGLGLIRTGELLAAGEYYGVEQYFTRAFDFGFSRSAEESFQKWGREAVLSDMVRAIRQFRPHVLVSVWAGDSRDGHGHHQACGQLAREAFRAAGEPNRFPELSQQGLTPWKISKLYIRASKADEATLTINTGQYVPLLGCSFQELASVGYGFHRSQGNGDTYAPPGQFDFHLRLVYPENAQDKGLLDSLDLKLDGLPRLLDPGFPNRQLIEEMIQSTDHRIQEAVENFRPEDFSGTVGPLVEGILALRRAQETLASKSEIGKNNTRGDLLFLLQDKEKDFTKALNLATGLYVEGLAEASSVTPGQTFAVRVTVVNRSAEKIELNELGLEAEKGWAVSTQKPGLRSLEPGQKTVYELSVTVSPDASPTRLPWKRNSRRDGYYQVDAGSALAAAPAPRLFTSFGYQIRGVRFSSKQPVLFLEANPLRGIHKVPLLVVPPVSLEVSPSRQLIQMEKSTIPREIRVKISNNRRSSTAGVLKAIPPPGWSIAPESFPFSLNRFGEAASCRFTVNFGTEQSPGHYPVQFQALVGGAMIDEESHPITVQDTWTFPNYRRAVSELEVLDLRFPADLTVGYITGPGDKVPDTLKELGIPVKLLSAEDLGTGDLSSFRCIVVGVRAYEVRDDLVASNSRLLEYVNGGGTLVVQYQRRAGWERGTFSPYPAKIRSDGDRVTDELAPVTILEPSNPIFNFPNHIGAGDFEDWVQERGLYFFQDRDPHFQPLLSMGDPGFSLLDGGLLVADYEKGKYILTALSWFRQLPEGVPGAIRLFVNLLSQKHPGDPP